MSRKGCHQFLEQIGDLDQSGLKRNEFIKGHYVNFDK